MPAAGPRAAGPWAPRAMVMPQDSARLERAATLSNWECSSDYVVLGGGRSVSSDPESVAEHSLRVAQHTGLIAAEVGADPPRAAYRCLWHDSQEARIPDMPYSARPYLGEKAGNETITRDQAHGDQDALCCPCCPTKRRRTPKPPTLASQRIPTFSATAAGYPDRP